MNSGSGPSEAFDEKRGASLKCSDVPLTVKQPKSLSVVQRGMVRGWMTILQAPVPTVLLSTMRIMLVLTTALISAPTVAVVLEPNEQRMAATIFEPLICSRRSSFVLLIVPAHSPTSEPGVTVVDDGGPKSASYVLAAGAVGSAPPVPLVGCLVAVGSPSVGADPDDPGDRDDPESGASVPIGVPEHAVSEAAASSAPNERIRRATFVMRRA